MDVLQRYHITVFLLHGFNSICVYCEDMKSDAYECGSDEFPKKTNIITPLSNKAFAMTSASHINLYGSKRSYKRIHEISQTYYNGGRLWLPTQIHDYIKSKVCFFKGFAWIAPRALDTSIVLHI